MLHARRRSQHAGGVHVLHVRVVAQLHAVDVGQPATERGQDRFGATGVPLLTAR